MTRSRDDSPSFDDLARQLRALNERAVREYKPLVDDLIRSESRDVRAIERTLDGLLDFCGHPPALLLFRRLCRHYYGIDAQATASYIRSYREMWDADSLPD